MGPENRFIKRVHDRLPASVYREKMHNVYRGGTPDVWYSGKGGDLWVEYKWVSKLPKAWKPPALSPLQVKWLNARHAEGRSVMVATAHPGGAVTYVTPSQWMGGSPNHLITVDGLAQFIERRCA